MTRRTVAEENDRRVLDAARDVFAVAGYDGTVAAVAEAAGVGIGSLYRRYPSKDDLLADVCLRSMRQMAEIARASLAAPGPAGPRLRAFVRECVAARCGALSAVAGRIPVSAGMRAAARDSQDGAGEVVEAARREGAIRDDVSVVDVLRLIELFGRAPRVPGDATDDAVRARLLAIALDGLHSGGDPLPGRPPSIRAYRSRWA